MLSSNSEDEGSKFMLWASVHYLLYPKKVFGKKNYFSLLQALYPSQSPFSSLPLCLFISPSHTLSQSGAAIHTPPVFIFISSSLPITHYQSSSSSLPFTYCFTLAPPCPLRRVTYHVIASLGPTPSKLATPPQLVETYCWSPLAGCWRRKVV